MTALILLAGTLLGSGFITLLRLARGEHPRPATRRHVPTTAIAPTYAGFPDSEATITTPLWPIRQAWRYCPTELRIVAMTLHPDGTATCDTPHCHTHTTTGD